MKKTSAPHIPLIQPCGENSSECGYCKGKSESSISYGVVCDQLPPQIYDMLMNVGWRRSGTYFYKPNNTKNCCKMYTIRLRSDQFQISKSQRQVLRRFERFINTGDVHEVPLSAAPAPTPASAPNDATIQTSTSASSSSSSSSLFPSNAEVNSGAKKAGGVGGFEQGREKMDLDTRGVGAASTEPMYKLVIETVPAVFTKEKYDLYVEYQTTVHGDKLEDLSESGFKRFLCDSPLKIQTAASSSASSSSGMKYPYGSYHQLYRLNGELVAVGVVDILPSGLSSVYFLYNNRKYKDLALGKVSALKEIEFARENNLPYYFMGYYIHTCDKMKYKAEYEPSELLCYQTLDFFPIKRCIEMLEVVNFTPFDEKCAAERFRIDGYPFPAIKPPPQSQLQNSNNKGGKKKDKKKNKGIGDAGVSVEEAHEGGKGDEISSAAATVTTTTAVASSTSIFNSSSSNNSNSGGGGGEGAPSPPTDKNKLTNPFKYAPVFRNQIPIKDFKFDAVLLDIGKSNPEFLRLSHLTEQGVKIVKRWIVEVLATMGSEILSNFALKFY